MPRKHVCDVPGCSRTRHRWQRICDLCWRALPGDIRTAITENWRRGQKAAWREACHRAGEQRRKADERAQAAASAAYERGQRLLGERS